MERETTPTGCGSVVQDDGPFSIRVGRRPGGIDRAATPVNPVRIGGTHYGLVVHVDNRPSLYNVKVSGEILAVEVRQAVGRFCQRPIVVLAIRIGRVDRLPALGAGTYALERLNPVATQISEMPGRERVDAVLSWCRSATSQRVVSFRVTIARFDTHCLRTLTPSFT